ncbi:transmembrane protein [Mycolicibacterium phlei]|uniref:Membrane protein n=1 Tax=Mycolicibacterium phlei DSM 43239 = CCUG 21000 TaxID=1226750 RepID=A0A5N5V6U7_MYCPH|nr:TPM domain-containing protein [Mycolicibacterium phlei]VEG10361.1 transmembrane protein [Mycobacteroides chelonae]AMO62257.1 chromosome segregation protein [Mycolicibacterium phlei]KAB7757408.1 membrane protein [Mycolicibacterium phlei DSM 43239 = CCUG 21000]KXW66305.1 membrane protein [Mycolicibacterium phlei DSM 43239 = CCUG 21000]KXW70308.1 membrane protein [Mycolicibacterium phlei DSM 43072]
MRFARLLTVLLALLTTGALLAPSAPAEAPMRLSGYLTDDAGALTAAQRSEVTAAIDTLYADRKTRLWVVYVETFNGMAAETWARNTMRASDLGSYDALLAVATVDRAYAFLVPDSATDLSAAEVDRVRRNDIEPALRGNDWAGAAIAAAQGLNPAPTSISWVGVLVTLAVLALAVLGLMVWQRRRRRKRREAEFAAARRVDPTDPRALAAVPLDALDDLSRAMVVEVDNAVRTSAHELEIAVEEFGEQRTEPFTRAVNNAKTTLAQAFNVRQILDDAVPETPAQRRDLLTRVIVAAAKADRELDAQRDAFAELRNLAITAPDRLAAMTQQVVDITARLEPARQKLAQLHTEFDAAALTSVDGNVDAAKELVEFADKNISRGRELAQRPVAGQQSELVDCVHAAESALAQARELLDAVDSAASDIRRAAAQLPATIEDIQNGIRQAGELLADGKVPQAQKLAEARDAAAAAVATAQRTGAVDPLGAVTELTKADAELDRLLAAVEQEKEAAERLQRTLDEAMFTARSRIRSVSDFIDTRRGAVGPEARTRLAEAVRQLAAADEKRHTDPAEAIRHANGAAMLASQAQTLAHNDVINAQNRFSGPWGGGGPTAGGGGGNLGAILGGILIGNILSGGRGGIGGGLGGGGFNPGSFGGSGGGGMFGGGGRF